MDKIVRWGATYSANLMCKGNKGILSIPIHRGIDNKQKFNIQKIDIKYNTIEVHFFTSPSSKPQSISYHVVENAEHDRRDQEGYREENERYD
jgi:hypothetical protein